ncbi:ARID domain-containing protein [Cephalotus follicularis]|uniref:ARID domain-containing protein n=1 Tax=Cephalotus follicularis TaxID=3775 RepID=A0A1Q3B9R1_CEPFO|nr:ARID domain-containing protein [Cephalotus follicularis]
MKLKKFIGEKTKEGQKPKSKEVKFTNQRVKTHSTLYREILGLNSKSMAGWSMVVDDGSALDCTANSKTPSKRHDPNDLWVDLELQASGGSGPVIVETEENNKLRCWFDQYIRCFLKEIRAQDCFWPIPPMLGNGKPVDLFKLFLVVRENDGYEAVSKNGLWELVAKECGLGLNEVSAVKLVYVKYLDALERWLERVVENKESKSELSGSGGGRKSGGFFMDLEAEIKEFLSEIPNLKNSNEEYLQLDLRRELSFSDDGNSGRSNACVVMELEGGNECVGDEESMYIDSKTSVEDFEEVGKSFSGSAAKRVVVDLTGDEDCTDVKDITYSHLAKSTVNLSNVGKVCTDDRVNSAVLKLDRGKKCLDIDKDVMTLNSGLKEEISTRKRKREPVWRMLSWVTEIAKNPCDPVVGSVPERSKWKSYGKEELWKQVLMYREAVFHADCSAEQSILQRNQKMHPCMYDDQVGSSYNLRERLEISKKLLFGKTTSQVQAYSSASGTQNDFDENISPYMKCMASFLNSSTEDLYDDEGAFPLGSKHQAEVPEWTGVVTESDSKWLGTRFWPLERVERRSLVERERIGKGRQDSCGCHIPDSVECVRFHIAQKKLRVKLELGSVFNLWNLDKMGEQVKLSWTAEEEKKFKDTRNLNVKSLEVCFWDKIFEVLPTKSRKDLASYYFNVFLLERRAYQNRLTSSKIDSDDEQSDDESVPGLVTNGSRSKAIKSPRSLLRSPNKPYRKV